MFDKGPQNYARVIITVWIRSRQTFSRKVQIINILGSADHIQSSLGIIILVLVFSSSSCSPPPPLQHFKHTSRSYPTDLTKTGPGQLHAYS